MSDIATLLIDHRQCAIQAAGVDLADAYRLQAAIARSDRSLLPRLFTADERAACDDGGDPIAVARLFGIKESVVKVLGGMPRGGRYRDMHVAVGGGDSGIATPVTVRLRNELARWAGAHRVEVLAGGAPLTDGLVLTWAVAVPAAELEEGAC